MLREIPSSGGRTGVRPPVLIEDDVFLLHQAAGHPERPDRLRAVMSALDDDPQLRHLARLPAVDAAPEDILLAHTPGHLARVRALTEAGGGWFDSDTYCGPHSFDAARRAAGAAMAAVDQVLQQGVAGAFALVRPPGHHAGANRAAGFCLFNNAAIAVRHAQRREGIGRVAVIDIDVHHGDGTESIFYSDPSVLYLSLHQSHHFPGTGHTEDRGSGAGLGSTVNLPLPAGTGGSAWLSAFALEAVPAVVDFRPDLIVVSAGFDAHAADPLAGLCLEESTYRRAAELITELSRTHCGRGTVWTLEGGYDLDALGSSVAASLAGMVAGS